MKENEIEKEPQEYSLEEADFGGKPDALEQWKSGERITRNNFNSLLINSFAASRGVAYVQQLFFEWLKQRDGFDYRTTINNFLERGGWDSLSAEEQTAFFKAFDAVKRHSEVFQAITSQERIKQEIENLADLTHGDLDESVRDIDLKQINDLEGFRAALNERIKQIKESRAQEE